MNRKDKLLMMRCFELAKKGSGNVSPNPMVGAVIVKKGEIISEGFHERYGKNHAEINAINSALQKNIDLTGSTIYINLEPCFHYGKTPPCVDALIKYGFSRVVISTIDPNPLIAGKSIKKLRKNGIRVRSGLLKKQGQYLNEKFFKFIASKKPFVALKAAQTSDGFIAKKDGSSKWITNPSSRRTVHQLRNDYDAVLVGAGTVLTDDPVLTVRTVHGRNPIRVIVDGKLSVSVNSNVFNSYAKTIVYTSNRLTATKIINIGQLRQKGVEVVQIKGVRDRIPVKKIIQDLYSRQVMSVLVEGGHQLYIEFLNARSVDKLYLFTAKKKFGCGIKTFGEISVSFSKKMVSRMKYGTDVFHEYSIKYRS
jgi:diaminohydroxyphosphoribosylaminopyrimidine deaminase/5-amino-6-(5-phosphoribosylamino)uracil reductase